MVTFKSKITALALSAIMLVTCFCIFSFDTAHAVSYDKTKTGTVSNSNYKGKIKYTLKYNSKTGQYKVTYNRVKVKSKGKWVNPTHTRFKCIANEANGNHDASIRKEQKVTSGTITMTGKFSGHSARITKVVLVDGGIAFWK